MTARTPVHYHLMWKRIKENPNKLVPIDISEPFVKRILRGLGQVKYLDGNLQAHYSSKNQEAILYHNRAPHPTKNGIVRVTFILRIFSNTDSSDSHYLRKFPPPTDLIQMLALEPTTLEELNRV